MSARVWQARPEETHDTPENRFVRHFAEQLREAIAQVQRAVSDARLREDGIGVLGEAMATLERAAWWPEVGPLGVMPVSSHVLLKGEGYRELYRLYPLFLLGRLPFSGDLGEAIANRDIATLYEWWCLFRLVKELGEICGPPGGEPWSTSEDRGPQALGVRFADGTVLRYQSWCRGGRGSYSVSMRPDFIIEHPRRGRICVDAKFSFRLVTDELGPDEEADPERHPTRRDLMTIHAYRDALRCRAAVILYPGDRRLFFGADGRRWEGLDIGGLMEESGPQGVGAIPYRPGLQDEVS
ncbi:DUF2357 domain-containing protein [Thermaerobacter composti]|uniref:DUF2357 domain-containing protein n=2 Tax=Thermaerobacter composti TaxID=554949 RepID=A0ABZ0QM69_9FIRM|nr:DUF2357 domain-containing protein [Thermaerobacter composti]WPD18586.1 DUF2357 domain-containing protein [Thermaerobacter composti]